MGCVFANMGNLQIYRYKTWGQADWTLPWWYTVTKIIHNINWTIKLGGPFKLVAFYNENIIIDFSSGQMDGVVG